MGILEVYMTELIPKKVILENGTEFNGFSFGSTSEKKLELVFNTSMVGYQEILSDPSYTDQAIVMTYPIIGNYGINSDDFESASGRAGALIVREYTPEPSNFRSAETLDSYMKSYDITGVYGIDTRELTRIIRSYGSCKVLITSEDISAEKGAEILSGWSYAHDQVARVSVQQPVFYKGEGYGPASGLHVAAIDCGMKFNIIRSLNKLGCDVTVLPHNTAANAIRDLNPNGIFLSNGPGDPEDNGELIETVRALRGEYPIFGICLGHQILSLAYGAETYKLKFGHRGGNHPVKNLLTDKVEITSQNHSFAVKEESLEGTGLEMTHVNLLDGTVEGVQCCADRAFSIQYHPESCPGPQDSFYLFEKFIRTMKGESLNA